MSILDTIITLGSFCGMFSDLESCPHELITKTKFMSQIWMEDELIYIPSSQLLLTESQIWTSFYTLQWGI